MNIIPTYQDIAQDLNMRKGQLPFYIGVSQISTSTYLHHHDYVEFSLVLDGSGVETVNGKPHRMFSGIASFLLPHHMHYIQSDPGQPLRKYCCMFNASMLFGSPYDSEWHSLLYGVGTKYPSFAVFEGIEYERMKDIFSLLTMENALDARQPGRSSMIRSKLTEALLLFLRKVSANHQQNEQPEEAAGQKLLLGPILQFIHVHYTEKLSLEQTASLFHISPPYVSRLFKKYTGQSFLGYVHRIRVDSAANLLISTDMPIADIAAESGFESLRTFSRVFLHLRGETPGAFRKRHENTENRFRQDQPLHYTGKKTGEWNHI